MTRVIRVAVAAALLTATILVGTTYAAELTSSSQTTAQMDRAACMQLKADVGASAVAESVKNQARQAKDTDCWTRTTQSWSDVLPFGVDAAAASSGCGSYWASFGVGILGVQVATSHTNVGLCWNGTKFTGGSLGGGINWGPDCYVSSIPFYFGGIDWCGVYWPNAGHTIAEPGNNFWVAAYAAPWWHRYGWMRFDVRATNGSSYNFRGGCCS